MTFYQQHLDNEFKTIYLLAQKLIESKQNEIILQVGDTTLFGNNGITSKIQYVNEPFQLLSNNLSYTFSLQEKNLEVSLQIYENINSHYRINCFSKFGSMSGQLFSINLSTNRETEIITFQQKIKFSDRIKTNAEAAKRIRSKKQESINHYLRTKGYHVDDSSNELYLGMYDIKNDTFIDTTAEKLIHDFLTISLVKGHYMGNKGFQFADIPVIN